MDGESSGLSRMGLGYRMDDRRAEMEQVTSAPRFIPERGGRQGAGQLGGMEAAAELELAACRSCGHSTASGGESISLRCATPKHAWAHRQLRQSVVEQSRKAQARASRCFERNPRHFRILGSLSLPAASEALCAAQASPTSLPLFTQHWLALAPAGRRSDLHPLERRSSHLALPRLIGARDDSHAPSISSSEASFQSSTGLLALPTRAKSCRIARAHGNLSSALAACQVPRSQSTLRHAQLQPSGIQPQSHSNLPRATMPG